MRVRTQQAKWKKKQLRSSIDYNNKYQKDNIQNKMKMHLFKRIKFILKLTLKKTSKLNGIKIKIRQNL